jgi:hypothetical protein
LSGGLSTTTGTAGCPCSLPRLRRRSWRAATQSGVCAEACAGRVVALIVVSSRKRRPPGRTRVATQVATPVLTGPFSNEMTDSALKGFHDLWLAVPVEPANPIGWGSKGPYAARLQSTFPYGLAICLPAARK